MDWIFAVFVCIKGDFARPSTFADRPAICTNAVRNAATDLQVHRGGCSTGIGVSADTGVHRGRQAAGESRRDTLCRGRKSDWVAGEHRIEMDSAVWEREPWVPLFQSADAGDWVVAVQLQHHDWLWRAVFSAGRTVVYGGVEISPSFERLSSTV